jgi:hypothetical protein
VVKRLVGVAVVAVMLAALSAGTASAFVGAPGFHIFETPFFVKADGPGFEVKLTKRELTTEIDDARFGIPEAGFPIVRREQDLGQAANLRPFVCENGTYRLVSGIFRTTQRASSAEDRPLPYTPAFNVRFPDIITFVGTLDAVVTDENGEQLRLLMSDLVHEVLTPRWFASTAPIHAYIVDSDGRVRDRASLVGRVNIDRRSGRAFHWILDRGTCHQTANLGLGPGTDQATVFGPFFVLPFNTQVVRLGRH